MESTIHRICFLLLAQSLLATICVGAADNANTQGPAASPATNESSVSPVADDEAPDPRIVKLVSEAKLDGIMTEHGMNFVRLSGRDGRGQVCMIKLAPVEADGEDRIFAASVAAKWQKVPKEIVKGLLNMNTVRRKFIWCDLDGYLAFRALAPLDATPEEFRRDVEFLAREADAVERVYLRVDEH